MTAPVFGGWPSPVGQSAADGSLAFGTVSADGATVLRTGRYVVSVTRAGVGVYNIVVDATVLTQIGVVPPVGGLAVLVSSADDAARSINVVATTPTNYQVRTRDLAGAPIDSGFSYEFKGAL